MFSRARGASFLDYMVLVALAIVGVGSAIAIFSPGLRAGASCQAAKIAASVGLGGDTSAACGGGSATPQMIADAQPIAAANSVAAPASGMTCDRMGCRGGNCFSPGTLVSTETGARAIESVVAGDRVWSRDETTGETALKRVTRVMVRPDQPLARIELASSHGGEIVKATSEHPFFVRGKGWTKTMDLAIDDVVEGEHDAMKVASIASTNEVSTVHNLEVEGFHTYFVGHAGALVHNDCTPDAGRVRPDDPQFDLSAGWNGNLTVIQRLWDQMARIDGKSVPPLAADATTYDYNAGWARVRSDFYGVVITLPPNTTAHDFLLEMQNDPHGVTGNDAGFRGWVQWDRPQTRPRPAGQVVDLDLYGPDNGPIVYIAPVTGAQNGPRSFTVMTAVNNASGAHPVNGYRAWGLTPLPRDMSDAHSRTAPQQYVLWTAGIDSASQMMGGRVGSWMQEATWSQYISSVAREVRRRGGTAADAAVYNTTSQGWWVTGGTGSQMSAPSSLSEWRYPRSVPPPPPPPRDQRVADIYRFRDSCTSDRRNCSGEVGREARRLLDGANGPSLDLDALMRPRNPAQRNGVPDPNLMQLLRQIDPPRAYEARVIAERGQRFYRDHGAAPGTCGNCHGG